MSPKKRERLDVLLVHRGLAESRTQAAAMVMAGQVLVDGKPIDKPGTVVGFEAELNLRGEKPRFVSRGGFKLEHALQEFGISAEGLVCLDVGASTGGFTDCLLQRGALRVYAFDVGRGQLHEKLRADPRVIARESLNARYLEAADLPEPVSLAVVDVSFISLKLVVPRMLPHLVVGGQLIALIKPQFEAGKSEVGKNGVVRDPEVRERIRADMVACAGKEWHLVGIKTVDSPLPGPQGNVEILLGATKAFDADKTHSHIESSDAGI